MTKQQKQAQQWAKAKKRVGVPSSSTRQETLQAMRRRLARAAMQPKTPLCRKIPIRHNWTEIQLDTSLLPQLPSKGLDGTKYTPVKTEAAIQYKPGYTEWKYGKAIKYHRMQKCMDILSAGRVEKDGLHWIYQLPVYPALDSSEKSGIMRAPRGYHWSKDELGIKLVSKKNAKHEYHPLMQDILRGSKFLKERLTNHISILKLTLLQQKSAKKKEDQKEKSWPAVLVCQEDSYAAGNCVAGTNSFKQLYGITVNYVEASKLVAIANKVRSRDKNYANRIMMACNMAFNRQCHIPII